MQFAEYYNGPFRDDLAEVVMALPAREHGAEDEVLIQPRTLSAENHVLCSWPIERRDLFATALFYTVLVDQVCYTHFRRHYDRFRSYTRYPKWKGNCPGGCRTNQHPATIFHAIRSLADVRPLKLASGARTPLPGSQEVMRREVHSFFASYMPEVEGEEFWRLCAAHLSASGTYSEGWSSQ